MDADHKGSLIIAGAGVLFWLIWIGVFLLLNWIEEREGTKAEWQNKRKR